MLSRIIKSPNELERENRKIIEIKPLSELNNFSIEEEEEINSSSLLKEDVELMYNEAKSKADRIIEQAQMEAEEMRKALSAEKEHWYKEVRERLEVQAREAGFQAGHEEGLQKAHEELSAYIKQAQETVAAAKDDYQKYLESSEYTILDIAMKVAGKVVNHTLTNEKEAFYDLVQKAVREVREYEEVHIHVYYSQYEELLLRKEELKAIFHKEVNLYIIPDDQLSEFDCIIKSPKGDVDASVKCQLDEAKRKLLEILEGEQ